MKNVYLYTVLSIILIVLSACADSDQISQEMIQTAIAETQLAQTHLDAAVVETLAANPTEIPTGSPETLAYDYSSWKGYNAPEGYFFNFPPRFNLEVRNTNQGNGVDFIVLGTTPQQTSFSIQVVPSAEYETLEATRDAEAANLDNAVFTDLVEYGTVGFIVEGIVPGDGFGGGSVVYEAYFELGELLINLDCPWNYCDREDFILILRSFTLTD